MVGIVLMPLREAFPRKARLTRMEITPGWMLSALAAIAGTVSLGFWSFHNVAYSDELWWRVMGDNEASRVLRASAGVAILFMVIGIWRLVSTPATPPVVGDDDPTFARVRAILASAEGSAPEANLALLGDKRFLFSQSGESFLMFGVRGRSWIALGAPVGRREERMELLWRFRELADAHAARPALYGIGPDILPEAVELGVGVKIAV
jgi:phosphatidylglycerol lysyltransferase